MDLKTQKWEDFLSQDFPMKNSRKWEATGWWEYWKGSCAGRICCFLSPPHDCWYLSTKGWIEMKFEFFYVKILLIFHFKGKIMHKWRGSDEIFLDLKKIWIFKKNIFFSSYYFFLEFCKATVISNYGNFVLERGDNNWNAEQVEPWELMLRTFLFSIHEFFLSRIFLKFFLFFSVFFVVCMERKNFCAYYFAAFFLFCSAETCFF